MRVLDDDTLWLLILSFSSTSDLIQVLACENLVLVRAASLVLSNAKSLHFSYLLELDRCRKLGSLLLVDAQETCVSKLLDAMHQTNHQQDNGGNNKNNPSILERIEFAGLRHLAGNRGSWLRRLFDFRIHKNLTSIDFSGCGMLDPRHLQTALIDASTPCATIEDITPSPIRYLNFQGCYRIDAQVVLEIAKSPKFRQLQSLGLGGCSQTIADDCVQAIFDNLRDLRYLDMSGLKRISESCSWLFQHLPDKMESLELAGCELIRLTSLGEWSYWHLPRYETYANSSNSSLSLGTIVDISRCTDSFWERQLQWTDRDAVGPNRKPLKNLTRLNFNGIGTPRRGLVEGVLPYFALRSMGSLREVYLSGCEQVQDWEIEVLAMVCAKSLNALEMRACCIGDDAVRAIGRHCTNLSDVDFSACFQITDEGIQSFCQNQGIRQHNHTTTVRSLRIAALLQVTNVAIEAIAALKSLLFLDVSNCPKLTQDALSATLKDLVSLVEVDAKGIGKWSTPAAALYSYDDEPRYLRFVNGRPLRHKATGALNQFQKETCFHTCTVRRHSKHLGQRVPLQAMYHCKDCRLVPALNRGMCHACSIHCHKDIGHTTFVGSFTRFYCDCPFGVVGSKFECQAISSHPIQRSRPRKWR